MRAVIQRVSEARVTVDGRVTGEIQAGLCALIGAGQDDESSDARYLVDKIANLRIFTDEAGKMNRSVLDIGGGVLAISQFTLYGDARKGRRPSFVHAMEPGRAEELYEEVVAGLKSAGIEKVGKGVFGADMKVALVNDGPVTILLDSSKAF
jgi:D-tyrosyl-tRNA(Tyr) deacylase